MSRLNLREILSQTIPFLGRRQGGLPRGELLALRPIRSPDVAWEMKDGGEDTPGAKLRVPRREDRMGQLLARVFRVPATRTVELDEVNAQIWARCDGKHSVDQLIRFTCTEYKLNRRQGEVGVVTLMKMLAQRRLIGFPAGAGTREGNRTAHVHPRSNGQRTERRPSSKRRGRRRY